MASPLGAVLPGPDEEDEVAVTPAFDIDRSSPTPLYFQLSQAFERAISDGSLPAGSKLENELLLAQQYGLSRPTVRRAVQELVDKGLLVRKRGVGTQVIQPHVRRSVELTSLYDDLARGGEAPSTEVLSLERVPVPADVALELDVGAGEEVVAHPGDEGGGVAETRGGYGDVGRAATEELAECGDVLEAHADLQRVEVDPAAAHGHHVGCVMHGALRPRASVCRVCRLCATTQSDVKTLSGHTDSSRRRRHDAPVG